jgi:hypothetical protein
MFLEVDANALHPFAPEIENASGVIGEVYDSIVRDWAAIVNPNDYGSAVL